MNRRGPPLALGERIDLLDRREMDMKFIDPEEVHFSHQAEEDPKDDFAPSGSLTSGSLGFESGTFSDLAATNTLHSLSSPETKHFPSLNLPDADDESNKAYAPRQTKRSRRSTNSSLRVKPRNGQHARELARNRQAAANYRSKQKNQLDLLLERARDEERRMVKQKAMVYSLKDELWHLRNELMVRQQLQIYGMTKMEPTSGAHVQQPLKWDSLPSLSS